MLNREKHCFSSQRSISRATFGTQLLKIQVSGSDWLDPALFRIMFDLPNDAVADATHNVYLIGGPCCFFSVMRILAGGQVV